MAASGEGPSAIRVTGLTKQFGSRKAVDDLSFELPCGSFLSIFGPNGAGKTTLLRMLATLARPTAGSIWIEGVDALEQPDTVRGLQGVISHECMLYPDLTAQENLVLYGQLHGVPDPTARARELLDAVGMKHRRMDRVRTFSRGMTQRVAIARALVGDPRVVLLDEPYAGLDPHGARILDDLLASIRPGRTFCMVSHDLERGLAPATHALVLSGGRAVGFQPCDHGGSDALGELCRMAVGQGVSR